MSMTKVIEIDGKQVAFKASAAIPRIYRVRYGRDIFKDLIKLDKELKENNEEDSGLTMCSLEAFENIAYLMAKHADPSIPDTAEEWLEEFSVFSIYQVLPEIITLWGVNLETQSEAKKKRHAIDRQMTTPLFLLRCVQLGISIRDLDLLTVGLVNDMYIESDNDNENYAQVATQRDFDLF